MRCPPGTTCYTIGLKIQELPLKAGWWRASSTSVDVKRCHDFSDDATSGCIGGSDPWACKANLDGPLCVLCKNGSGFYYNRDINACEECGPRTTYVTVILFICVIIGAGLVAGVLMYYCSLPAAKACKPKRRMLRSLWEALRSLMVSQPAARTLD